MVKVTERAVAEGRTENRFKRSFQAEKQDQVMDQSGPEGETGIKELPGFPAKASSSSLKQGAQNQELTPPVTPSFQTPGMGQHPQGKASVRALHRETQHQPKGPERAVN